MKTELGQKTIFRDSSPRDKDVHWLTLTPILGIHFYEVHHSNVQ